MSEKHSTRTLWCKAAEVDLPRANLQHLLEDALAHRDPMSRMQNTSPGTATNAFQVIAQHYRVGKGIGGIFTSYIQGASAVSLELGRGVKQLTLAQLQPPKSADANKIREWAEGLLYFFCWDNYIVVIQSSAVRIGQFEEHLSWLFKKPGDTIGPAIQLKDRPAREVADKVRKSHIKSIDIGGDFVRPTSEVAPASRAAATYEIGGSLLTAVKSMLEGKDSGFRWPDALGSNMKMSVRLTFDRSTTSGGQSLLDKIGLAFRHLNDVDTVLHLQNGQTITSAQMRLTTSRKIKSIDHVLAPEDAFAVMNSWLIDLANAGDLG